jgi:type I restriction enzyme S subunit
MYRPFLISLGFGAAQQNISQDEIKKYKIVFPNKELAKEFSKRISNIFETVKILQKENASLSSARDRLLPRLISGRLKV